MRLWLWLLLGSAALTALFASLAIAFDDAADNTTPPLSTPEGQHTLFSVASGTRPLIAVLAAIALTGEFRHRTASATFLATPHRGGVVAAKLVTYAVVGAAYALVCIAVTIAIALPWLSAKGIDVHLAGDGIPATFTGVIAVLAEEGIRVRREEDAGRFLGISDAGCFALAFRDAGRDLAPASCEALVERKSERYRRGIESVRLFPGARALVEEAARRLPVTIASCGRREDIENVLDRHGLRRFFDRFISADDIQRSKPDPEVFLKALALLRAARAPDLEPRDCLVFEDSVRGVEAARRAGMLCVAVAHTYPAAALAAADRVVASLHDWRW